MPRSSETSGVRLPAALWRAIDEARGELSRSAWIQTAAAAALERTDGVDEIEDLKAFVRGENRALAGAVRDIIKSELAKFET